MSDVAIKFENVSKLYRLGTVGTGWLSHDIKRWWITSIMRKEDPYLRIGETNDRSSKGNSDYVYALKDIDFEVKQGDVLGIIGKNGAGKSTLLKLLSRVTAPTTGKIYTKGRIASLLEVGTGFHPELTGRENIYMNGTIMGMKKWEIDKKLDEIVDFSGCERYLDTPVKRYSSGMMVRLGFAVAAHLEPEILVVDEVLAVGDAEFQKKAIGKMQDVSKGEGRTVLFVSHNMDSIRRLCVNGVLLKNGWIEKIGLINSVVDDYLTDLSSNVCRSAKVMPHHRPAQFINPALEIIQVSFDTDPMEMSTDEPISVSVRIHRNDKLIDKAYFAVIINDAASGYRVCDYYTDILSLPNVDDFDVVICCSNHNLSKRKFTINIEASINIEGFGGNVLDMANNILSFEIKYKNKEKGIVWTSTGGVARPDNKNVSATIICNV